jgi:hypothetical protein
MIKLLHTSVQTEPTKGCFRLFFLAGKRVLDFTRKALDNEKGLMFCCFFCSCGPDEHVVMVDKLQKSLKAANKVSHGYLTYLYN